MLLVVEHNFTSETIKALPRYALETACQKTGCSGGSPNEKERDARMRGTERKCPHLGSGLLTGDLTPNPSSITPSSCSARITVNKSEAGSIRCRFWQRIAHKTGMLIAYNDEVLRGTEGSR